MKKFFAQDEIVGCWGEGYSIYKVTQYMSNSDSYYLEAYANTSVDAGWCNSQSIRKVASKKKIKQYSVKFEIENPE